jgi:hypothetical protein
MKLYHDAAAITPLAWMPVSAASVDYTDVFIYNVHLQLIPR